jgi:hypothetical protein
LALRNVLRLTLQLLRLLLRNRRPLRLWHPLGLRLSLGHVLRLALRLRQTLRLRLRGTRLRGQRPR